MKYRGEDSVVGSWFGDGATSEGDWHESLNFAGIHKLPIVFVCENNKYAISVPLKKQAAVEELSVRAEGYGFAGMTVDGNDVFACFEAMKGAVERARDGGGPTLVETTCYRFYPHTSDDDDRTYRSREEVDEARKNDPILQFANYLTGAGLLDEAKLESIREEVKGEVDKAVEEAWNSPDPDPESAMEHVFAEASRYQS
jgi:2-oxoisovalerate dehydrogenase E1 component alpha subunit